MRKKIFYKTIIALKSRTVAKNSPALVLFISAEQLLALNVCRYLGDIGNIDLAIVVDIAFDTTAIGRYTECVFDKICEWIMYNYMENTKEYIESKQWEISSLVYSFNPPDVFKTPEFQARMNKWVAEIIERMVSVRKLYEKKSQKEN